MRYRRWLLQLFVWDGLLPLALVNAAAIVPILFPNPRWLGELGAVFLPIFGFFVRMRVAYSYAEENESNGFQYIAFWLALLLLMCLDALLILFIQEAALIKQDDWLTWLMLYGVYLVIIGFALFPFKGSEISDQEL